MRNVVGNIIAVMAIFLLVYVTPLYYTGIVEWAKASVEALSYTRDLIDGVIDTRELTDDMLNDYAISMASTAEYYRYEVIRKEKCIMPDPITPGQTYSTYIVVDDISKFNQGDKVIVKVEPAGSNIFQTLSTRLMHMASIKDGFNLVGRVR